MIKLQTTDSYGLLPIGFMQGRASPKYKGRFQAHPVGAWEHEFLFARQDCFDCIEFIVDLNDYHLNPLLSEAGIDRVAELVDMTQVRVRSICADCFMEVPFYKNYPENVMLARELLRSITKAAIKLNVEAIVLPCVDASSLENKDQKLRLQDELLQWSEFYSQHPLKISLETDLPPQEFGDFITKMPLNIGVNYDTGNSASLGFDIVEEFSIYGDRINDIHIKDRTLGGGSVLFGEGVVDFEVALELIRDYKYQGPIIMQSYREENGQEFLLNQLKFLRKKGW